ncbi:hypothetical protein [Amycolatopsis sp. 195334CR]|uniref:hypothetical protein n=1 Tax=Amycolatopsis sp. 195334CR TaxID=2814588 RepID=UPI001A8CB6D1|nr:hypothetical protein [Amycolatopsis sp. 195334CR]MBN6040729.1 hypothetical protein [Amycolatopsis sp. 195334CR]
MEPLDPIAYEDHVVKPHRTGAVPAAEDELFARYALSGEMTDDELVARTEEVRALWRRTSAAVTCPRPLKRVYDHFLAEDAELRATYGAMLESAQWWRSRETTAAPDELATFLKDAYEPLSALTPRLLSLLHSAFPGVPPHEVERAVQLAGLSVREAHEVPVPSWVTAALAAGLPLRWIAERIASAEVLLAALDQRATEEAPPPETAVVAPKRAGTPPRELEAATKGLCALLRWEPGEGHTSSTRYRVGRHEDEPPGPTTGVVVTETAGTEFLDADAPVGPCVHYAVFARSSAEDEWSAPARTSIPVFPSVELRETRRDGDRLELVWQVRPETTEVRIRRTPGDVVVHRAVRREDHGRVSYQDNAAGDAAYQVQPVYELADGSRHTGEPLHFKADVLSTTDEPVTVELEPAAPGFGPRVTARWDRRATGAVRVRFAPAPPDWHPGDRISATALETYGEELRGRPEPDGDRVRLTGEVAPGWQWYLPVAVTGAEATVGVAARLGTALPVSEPVAQRRGAEIVLSWIWPPGLAGARVSWTDRDGEPQSVDISAYAYEANGCRIQAGTDPIRVEIRGTATSSDGVALSAPEIVEAPGYAARVDYTVQRSRWRRREATITFAAIDAVRDGEVVVIAAAGPLPPEHPAEGVEVARHRLALEASGSEQFAVELPADHRWVVCFAADPGAVELGTASARAEVRR